MLAVKKSPYLTKVIYFTESGVTPKQEKLVTENIALVYSITARYKNWSNYEDIVSEGFLGLCCAAVSFSELRGNCFSTFAYKYISGKCLNFINRDKIVKPKRRYGVFDKIQTITLNTELEACFPDVLIIEERVDGIMLFDTLEKNLTPLQYKIVCKMYEGYKRFEISKLLDISMKQLSEEIKLARETLSKIKDIL
jgi:RNA polymerase sigma factor (sigma-70 family)